MQPTLWRLRFRNDLSDDELHFEVGDDPDANDDVDENNDIKLTHEDADGDGIEIFQRPS